MIHEPLKQRDKKIKMTIETQELIDKYKNWVSTLLIDRWGSTTIVTRGKLYEADTLPGYIALDDGVPKGLITYYISNRECEVISLDSLSEGIGVGSALLKTIQAFALSRRCQRIWLITTNDNTAALRFYQKRGFKIIAVYNDEIAKSRKLKPEIPNLGNDGIPIRDEIELEMKLS